jgi:Fur family transcriptional regulator, ferric uptake regulator
MESPAKKSPAAKKTADAEISSARIALAIRSKGARATHGRIRILSILKAAPSPLSHADIENLLAKAREEIDKVTLYRVLDWLVDAGFALKSLDTRGVFCYMAADENKNHARHVHFRCIACGGVYCLDTPVPHPPKLPSGFHLTRMNMDIQGECGHCSKAAA